MYLRTETSPNDKSGCMPKGTVVSFQNIQTWAQIIVFKFSNFQEKRARGRNIPLSKQQKKI